MSTFTRGYQWVPHSTTVNVLLDNYEEPVSPSKQLFVQKEEHPRVFKSSSSPFKSGFCLTPNTRWGNRVNKEPQLPISPLVDIICLLIGWSNPVKKCHEVPPLGSSTKSPTQTFRRTPLNFSVWKWGIPSTHGHFMSINLENDDRPMDLGAFPWLFTIRFFTQICIREQTVGPHLLHVETVLQMHHLPQNPHLSLVRRHHLHATPNLEKSCGVWWV